MEKFKGLPGIEEYLASQGNGFPVDIPELDHVADALVAYFGFTKEQGNRIVALFFQEIRSAMLKGEVVDIRGFGTFSVSSPATCGTKKQVFAKFKAKKCLINRMKNERTRTII